MALLQRASASLTRALPLRPLRSRLTAPVASLSFDDFPRSAWTVGGPILERHGVRATYYPAGRFCGAVEDGLTYFRREDLAAIAAAGHELGCHSFGHEHGPRLITAELAADAERNAAFLAETLGELKPVSYAYPFGDASPRTKALAARRYAVSRGIRPGVNAGLIDLAQLRAVPLEQRQWRNDFAERLIARATDPRRPGWIIFFSHDVSDSPSPYGCTPEMLEWVIDTLKQAGVEILPVKHALARAAFGAG